MLFCGSRHANNHFEDDELARDMELARQIAVAPISPSQTLVRRQDSNYFKDEELARDMELAKQIAAASTSPSQTLKSQLDNNMSLGACSGKTSESTMSIHSSTSSDGDMHIDKKVCCLVSLQIRSNFYKIEDGLMALLRNCLESETAHSTSILSGYVDHFQSLKSEDVGFGCGWRNIQMLSSHLLMQRQEVREVLFGGSGFVPDIVSLQRWLEIAWEKDFDRLGSDHFNQKIYGSRTWIGTTECAALFRSFGLRARIVDFGPKESESLFLSVPGSSHGGKRKAAQINGPMDRFLFRSDQNVPQAGSSMLEIGDGLGRGSSDGLADNDKFARKTKGQHALFDWVWNYFSDTRVTVSGNRRVIVSEKAPLYFQHDGHSRTIVGIQVKHQWNGMPLYNLLILDPAHRSADLERSLKGNAGWQRLIKRGVHTLKKPQYQLCYIDPGIARGEEMEQLKTLDSVFFEL